MDCHVDSPLSVSVEKVLTVPIDLVFAEFDRSSQLL